MMSKLRKGNGALRAGLRVLGGPVNRLLLVMLSLVVAAYLAYQYAYIPLLDDAELPAVVQARNARIDTKALDSVITSSKQRIQHVHHSYDQYRPLFAHVSTDE